MRRFAARLIPAVLAFVAGVAAEAVLSGAREFESQAPAAADKQLVVPVLLPLPPDEESAGPDFNPTGHYYFPDARPKGFEDVDWMTLDTVEIPEHSYRWVLTPPQGFIRTRNLKTYEMARINLNGAHLSFSTESVEGVSYHFAGSFTERGVFYDTNPENIVLRGTLTKKRGGRTLAESAVGFKWFRGD